MTEKEKKYSIGLPLSVILCIICAAGGSSIFASLYSGLALLIVGFEDYAVLVVKEYIFVFVFCTVYSAVFVSQMKKWSGGKLWQVVHILFLLFYLTAYMFKFWPQTPQMIPDFTVRAFLWYGGALAISLVSFDYGIKKFDQSSGHNSSKKLILYRNSSFTFGSLVVILPLALTSIAGIAFDLPLTFTFAPMSLLILTSAIYVYKECRDLRFIDAIAHLLVVWYPIGWCFLIMPLVLVLEKVLSSDFLEVFVINSTHLHAAILSFSLLVLALIVGGIVGTIGRSIKV